MNSLVCSGWGAWSFSGNYGGPCGNGLATRSPTGTCSPSISAEYYLFSGSTFSTLCSTGTRIRRRYVRLQIASCLLSVVGSCTPGCYNRNPVFTEVDYGGVINNTPASCIAMCSSLGYSMAGLTLLIDIDSMYSFNTLFHNS